MGMIYLYFEVLKQNILYLIWWFQGFGSAFFRIRIRKKCGSGPGKNMGIRADPDPKPWWILIDTDCI